MRYLCVSQLIPSVTLKEIREDLFDAYVYIQEKLNDAIQASRDDSPLIDTTRCCVTGGSAGGAATMWLVGPDTQTFPDNSASMWPNTTQQLQIQSPKSKPPCLRIARLSLEL